LREALLFESDGGKDRDDKNLQFSGVVETHAVFLISTAKLELGVVQNTDPTSVKGNLLNYGVVGTFVSGLRGEQLP
jgi:hypothetical protein